MARKRPSEPDEGQFSLDDFMNQQPASSDTVPDMIDLAEEQYRATKIPTLRDQGKKLKPLGHQYSATSRAMAHKITEVLSSRHYDVDIIDQYANAYMKR